MVIAQWWHGFAHSFLYLDPFEEASGPGCPMAGHRSVQATGAGQGLAFPWVRQIPVPPLWDSELRHPGPWAQGPPCSCIRKLQQVRGQGSLREYYRVWRGSGRCPGELAACQAAFILPCLLRQERCSIIKAKYAPLTDSVEYREGKLKKQVVNWWKAWTSGSTSSWNHSSHWLRLNVWWQRTFCIMGELLAHEDCEILCKTDSWPGMVGIMTSS